MTLLPAWLFLYTVLTGPNGSPDKNIRLGKAPYLYLFTFLYLLFIRKLMFRHRCRHKMSASHTPTLQEDQVAALAEEAAAAVRAAMDELRRRPGGGAAPPPPRLRRLCSNGYRLPSGYEA